jgi:DNA-binding PadR family transcriptional regulator
MHGGMFNGGHGLFRGRHGGSGRGGGGSERGFEHGKLRFVLLKLIADKPSHGYELIKAIEERTQGNYSPSPGAIYPTLAMLEELGHITLDDSDGQRRLCQITAAGEKFLADNQEIVAELEARLARPMTAASGMGHRGMPGGLRGEAEVAAPIVRALENLHTALRLRLGGSALKKDQIQTIAAVLDDAATTVERT